jgi:phosphoglycerate dehydrogenase-like enzyme
MAARPGLRLIAKHGSGVDNIDIPGATERGVLVANTPGGTNSTAVAEGAVTLMLAVLRRVRDMDALMRDDRFDQRWSIELGDLTGGSLGLLGFGQIARQVARICGAGFGMDVGAYDPFVSADAMKAAGVRKVEALPELMRNDVISIHVPFSEQTRHVVGAKELAAMSANAIIVNTARGGLIDEAALARALVEGRIRGAGIDVFEAEPPPRDNPLLGLPNVVLSPHVAGVTSGSMKGMAMAVADVVETVLAGKRPATLLNREVLGETR